MFAIMHRVACVLRELSQEGTAQCGVIWVDKVGYLRHFMNASLTVPL